MYDKVIKRCIDFTAALVAIIFFIPLFLVIFAFIKADSRGPVFFRQTRSGRNRKPFTILKFRTMYVNAPKDVPTYLLDDIHTHITPIGRFLRRTSLDELPQLFNILAGQMSFIGPRPVQPMEEDILSARDSYNANKVLPGLSGLAQVNGRDKLRNDQKTRFDGIYVARHGFVQDLKIFFKTFAYVLLSSDYWEGRLLDDGKPEEQERSISETVENLRQVQLESGAPSAKERTEKLKALRINMILYKNRLFDALKQDFNKCKAESLMTEYYSVMHELRHFIKNTKRYSRPKRARGSLATFPSSSKILPMPYGVVLIMSPWNYPFQLTMSPLIGAYAAGNRLVVKPSNYTPNTSSVIAALLGDSFTTDEVVVVLGGREQNSDLLKQRFDYIFFTGGSTVGRLVMEAAAKELTPITLELGGKSPCIVDADADIDLAARRIAWGKFINAGQTCVAPDYVLVSNHIKEKFLISLKQSVERMFYSEGRLTEGFAYVINERHAQRLSEYIEHDKDSIYFGGRVEGRSIEPTILTTDRTHPAMGEEIFGPVLPIIGFDDLGQELDAIARLDSPLAFYYFSKNAKRASAVMQRMKYGGGCVNDVVLHASSAMPFGGVGASGMGSYHGKKSFDTFTHYASVLMRGKQGIKLMYPPYTTKKTDTIERMAK